MKRYGEWDVSVACDEQPDLNFYGVDFTSRKTGEAVACVHARVYTNFGVNAKEARAERLKPEALKDTPDAELLRIAEIEINARPGLREYVPLPGAAVWPGGAPAQGRETV